MGQECFVCESYVIKSILTVFYQKNTVEIDWESFEAYK